MEHPQNADMSAVLVKGRVGKGREPFLCLSEDIVLSTNRCCTADPHLTPAKAEGNWHQDPILLLTKTKALAGHGGTRL